MQDASLPRRKGPIAVWAPDDRLRDRISSALGLGRHKVLDARARRNEALALVLACSQVQFVRDVRITALRSDWTGIPLVVVATGSWNARGWKSIRSGVEGLVRESELEQTLAASVDAVLADQLCLPRVMRDALARPVLSHREKQVLELALSGLTNAQIGGRLFLSESTVKSHLSSSFRKLRVSSRAEAARRMRASSRSRNVHRVRRPAFRLPAGQQA